MLVWSTLPVRRVMRPCADLSLCLAAEQRVDAWILLVIYHDPRISSVTLLSKTGRLCFITHDEIIEWIPWLCMACESLRCHPWLHICELLEWNGYVWLLTFFFCYTLFVEWQMWFIATTRAKFSFWYLACFIFHVIDPYCWIQQSCSGTWFELMLPRSTEHQTL